MPLGIQQGASSPTPDDNQNTETTYKNPRLRPITPAAPTPAQPKQPPPDPQVLETARQRSVNNYIYARAQRYLVGSAFTAQYEKAPGYWDPDATTGAAAQWWTTHPQMFGSTITANVPEEQHRKLVKHVPGIYDWIGQHDQVAGVNGVLTNMRLTALHITNPEVRTWAINYIDSIKNLSSGDQQGVLFYMMNLTGSKDPNALLHEALHVRRGYINAYLQNPATQAREAAVARQTKSAMLEQREPGQDFQGQLALAQEEYQKALAAGGQVTATGPGAAKPSQWDQQATYWYDQVNQLTPQAEAEKAQQQAQYAAEHPSLATRIGADVGGLLKKGGEALLGGLTGQQPQAIEQGFQQHIAPSIEHWWNNGNSLPFTVHFPHWMEQGFAGAQTAFAKAQVGQGNFAFAAPTSIGTQLTAAMGAPTLNRSLRHFSAKSEVEAALATASVASVVFAPGLIEFIGDQAVNLAKIQAFMKVLHGLNIVTQQVGNALQTTSVGPNGVEAMGVPTSFLNPLFHAAGTTLGGIASGLHAATAAADNLMLDAQTQLAQGTASAAQGFGWNMSPTQANVAAQIEMAMMMDSISRFGGDIKANLGMTADAVAGQLNVGETLGDTYRLSDSSMMHPWQSLTHPLIDHATTTMMQWLHATDLPTVFERWNDSSFLGRQGMFDTIDSWRTDPTGPVDYRTVLGKIRERYPMLPADYAEMLAKTPRDEMLGASMQYIDGWGVKEFASTKGQLNSVKAKLAKLAIPDLSGTQVVYKGQDISTTDMFPEPLRPDGKVAVMDAQYPPVEATAAQTDTWWNTTGNDLLNKGWIQHDDPYKGEVLLPPDTVMPGTPEFQALQPDYYQPHPLEGQPKPVYAGHAYPFADFEKAKFSEGALHGPGLYTTEDFTVAGGEPDIANIESAQASGGDLMTTDANLGYAGKHMGPTYQMHEIGIPPDMANASDVAKSIYIKNEAIAQRASALQTMGLDPAQYNIEAILSPEPIPGGGSIEGPEAWRTATKVTQKGVPEPAPNVHYGYMDIKNPLDLEHMYSASDAADIMTRAGVPQVLAEGYTRGGQMSGSDIRNILDERFGARGSVEALQSAGFDGLTHIGGNIMGGGHEHRVWIAFEPDQFHRGLTPAMLDEQNALLAQKAALEDKLTSLQSRENEVITNLPTNSMPDFLHRVMYRPVGPVEATFRTILNFGRYVKKFGNWSAATISGDATAHWFNEDSQSLVAKLVDKLDSRPQLRYASQDMPRAERQIIEDNNAQIMDRLVQRIGMTSEDAAYLKGRLAAVKSQEEWFNVVSRDLLGEKGQGAHLLSKYLPDNTPKWLRDRILSMNEGGSYPKYYTRQVTGLHGQTELGGLLEGELNFGDRAPLPAAPSMFKNSYNLPISDIETALGTVSRWRARVGDVSWKKGDLFNNAAAQVFDWGKAAMSLTTAVGKPLVMVANIPAIMATKMLDETMGNAMDPRIMHTFHTRADALDYFSRIDPRIMGRVVAGSSWVGLDGHDVSTEDITRTAQSMFMNGMDRQTAESVAQRLVDMSTDPLLSRIALENDPERMLAVLYGEGHVGIDPNAEGIIHAYRGEAPSAMKTSMNDSTKYWYKSKFVADTSGPIMDIFQGAKDIHEQARNIAQSYATTGGEVKHYIIDPNARILTQGTPEFDAIVGPGSEFHSQADQTYVPGSILPGSGKDQAYQLDQLYQKAQAAGYQAIHMTDQDALGTAVIDPSILRDPSVAAQPVMADEHLQRFFDEQLRPQVERSLEAFGIPVTEEAVRARTHQLMVDWATTIHDATWNHPDLLDFVKHGRMGGRGIPMDVAAKMTPDAGFEYQSLVDEAAGVRERLSQLDPKTDPASVVAAQQHLHDKLEAIDHIENTVLGTGDQTDQLLGAGAVAEQIRQDTQKALADRVDKLWKQNELTPPNKFTVRTDVARLRSSSTTDVARSKASRIQDFMYRNGQFQWIGKAEAATAKGSFFSQRADQIAKSLVASGMRTDEAVALAEWRAMDETRTMNYDITAKSTAERSIRNLMWFAPVQGELMYRWLYAIPAQSGAWLPGAVLTAARLTNWYHMLKTTGLIHHDTYTGQDVIKVPGLARFINLLNPGPDIKLPDTTAIPVLSINPHLFGAIQDPLPTLSPVPSWALDTVAQQTHSKVLLDLSSTLSGGGTNQFVPSAINSLLAMYGVNVGNHMLGTSYQRLQWDRAHDVGLQYAYTDLTKQGVTAPTLAQFGLDSAAKNYIVPSAKTALEIDRAANAYQAAQAGWFDQLNSLADQYARGAYALNALSSAVLPGYIQESSTDQRAYQNFFAANILPKIQTGDTSGISNSINKWLAVHPNSQAFAISYNWYTGKTWDTQYQQTDPQYAKQLYTQGIKAPMDPKDYANFLAGKAMIENYRAQLAASIQKAAPDGKWQTLLRNWYISGQATAQHAQELDMFDRLNPDALAIYNKAEEQAQAVNGIYPHQGLVYQYVQQTMNDLRIIAPKLLGGDISTDFSAVMSRLGQAKAQLYRDWPGAANDPMTKGINWYFDNVVSPYYNTVNPLYEKAKQLTAQGADRAVISDIYHKIDVARRAFDNPKHGAPSPQEFAYASLSPYDQKLAVLSWSTQPPSWLSEFQYEKVYGQGSFGNGVNHMFDAQFKFNKDSFLPAYEATSPSSNYAASLRTWRDQQYAAMGQYFQNKGVPHAERIMQLEQAAPYERLKFAGWGQNSAGMKSLFQLATQANDAITAAGDSPSGFSKTAVAWKSWFYNNLNNYMNLPEKKPDGTPNTEVIQFHRLMDQLSQSQKTVGTTGIRPTGLSLYEEIFFNNFSLDKFPAPTSITDLFK